MKRFLWIGVGSCLFIASYALHAGPPTGLLGKSETATKSSERGRIRIFADGLQDIMKIRRSNFRAEPEPSIEDYIKSAEIVPYSSEGRLNPIGAFLIKTHLQTLSGFFRNMYIVLDVHCLTDLLDKLPASDQTLYFAVFTGNRHWTPVVVLMRRIFILESLGVEKSKVGRSSVAQIGAALVKSRFCSGFPILCTKASRQYDNISCGTDCFYVFKLMEKHYHVLSHELDELAKRALTGELTFTPDLSAILDEEAKDLFSEGSLRIVIFVLPTLPAQLAKITQNPKLGEQLALEIASLGLSSSLSRKHSSKISAKELAPELEAADDEQERLEDFINRKSSSSIQLEGQMLPSLRASVDSEIPSNENQMTATPLTRRTNATLDGKKESFNKACVGILKLLSNSQAILSNFYEACGFDIVLNASFENLPPAQKIQILQFFKAVQEFDSDSYIKTRSTPLPCRYLKLKIL